MDSSAVARFDQAVARTGEVMAETPRQVTAGFALVARCGDVCVRTPSAAVRLPAPAPRRVLVHRSWR